MAGIFVFSEKTLLAAELVTFARAIGKSCTVIAIGREAAEKNSTFGAEQVVCLNGVSDMAESYAKPIAALLKEKGAEIFAVGATPSGRDLAARVAGYLDIAMVSDVSAATIEGDKLVTERMMYGGALTRKEALTGIGVITIPSGAHEPAQGERCEIIAIDVEADDRVTVESTAPIVREGADLSVAERVVCVGMGFSKKEDLKIAYDLAEALGAEVAGTRPVTEDCHWFSSGDYIGLSGIRIKPRIYIGLGLSGQIQHSVGVRESQVIVAINKDSKAPIFSACDYGIVGDMFELVPLITAAIK